MRLTWKKPRKKVDTFFHPIRYRGLPSSLGNLITARQSVSVSFRFLNIRLAPGRPLISKSSLSRPLGPASISARITSAWDIRSRFSFPFTLNTYFPSRMPTGLTGHLPFHGALLSITWLGGCLVSEGGAATVGSGVAAAERAVVLRSLGWSARYFRIILLASSLSGIFASLSPQIEPTRVRSR